MVEGIQARDSWQTDSAIAKLQEAERGWAELNDEYLRELTASALQTIKAGKAQIDFNTATGLLNQGGPDSSRQALEKFQSAGKLYEEIAPKMEPGTLLTWEGFSIKQWQANSL